MSEPMSAREVIELALDLGRVSVTKPTSPSVRGAIVEGLLYLLESRRSTVRAAEPPPSSLSGFVWHRRDEASPFHLIDEQGITACGLSIRGAHEGAGRACRKCVRTIVRDLMRLERDEAADA